MNITSNMMNQGCTLASNTMSPRPGNGNEVDTTTSDSEVAFHRHCQATVLSAFGTEMKNADPNYGNGLTWDVIKDLGRLDNIQDVLGDDDPWLGYFTKNNAQDNNNRCTVTHDLASILELINKVAGKGFKIDIGVKASTSSTPFATHQFNTNNALSLSYNYVIGRDISFKIDGKTIKFNTTQSSSSDVLSDVEFPKSTLTILKNWNTRVYVDDIYMQNDYEVDVSHDYCHIPCIPKTNTETITISQDDHIYKVNISANFSPKFSLANYSQLMGGTDIISWELHLTNIGSDNCVMTINSSTFTIPGNPTFSIIPLTNLHTVKNGQTNVYVFRYDIGLKKLTYSLAYIC